MNNIYKPSRSCKFPTVVTQCDRVLNGPLSWIVPVLLLNDEDFSHLNKGQIKVGILVLI